MHTVIDQKNKQKQNKPQFKIRFNLKSKLFQSKCNEFSKSRWNILNLYGEEHQQLAAQSCQILLLINKNNSI